MNLSARKDMSLRRDNDLSSRLCFCLRDLTSHVPRTGRIGQKRQSFDRNLRLEILESATLVSAPFDVPFPRLS